MDRQVPSVSNDSIELYMKTYYSLLRSSGEIKIRSLEESHATMESSLHTGAQSNEPDVAALGYAWARLPPCMPQVQHIFLGQSVDVFKRKGVADLSTWDMVESKARRRHAFFDGKGTMAALIASVSDIDDMIPMITAYQMEWNKLHRNFLQSGFARRFAEMDARGEEPDHTLISEVREASHLSEEDFDRLTHLFGKDFWGNLRRVVQGEKHLTVRLLTGSLSDYRKAAQGWWRHLTDQVGDIFSDRPVYFVSSNTHVLPNLFGGYSRVCREDLLSYLRDSKMEDLHIEVEEALAEAAMGNPGLLENLCYYTLRARRRVGNLRELMAEHDRKAGIHNIESVQGLDVDAQVLELKDLIPENLDPRLKMPGLDRLKNSKAILLNIDYPLGMAAYHVFTQVSASVDRLAGVYVMGKAATLNGRVGDVMIPNVVFDQHSQNTYLFRNCLRGKDVSPYLGQGTVLDNQKSMTVRGTFLQNSNFMHLFYAEGYTDIEMEGGPYLSAVYEDVAPKRHPTDEIVNLFLLTSYELGFLHYASDTPISRRQELLSRSLSYFGIDSTYACGVAIFRRILAREIETLGG